MGLDNGGTMIKAAIFDLAGREIVTRGRSTALITPRPGYTERDMDALWQVNCACAREAIGDAGIDPASIIGVSICGHGKGLYLWGRDGRPVRNGIVSTDSRAWEYPEKWRDDGTAAKLYPRHCQKLLASQQVSLLAWLKDHEREQYDRIQWVFSVKDYVRFRLTGEAWSEVTDISGSGLLDIMQARFDRDMLTDLGIGEVYERLPPLRYSSEKCGAVCAGAAALSGLKEGTPVAGGMFDIDACAVAMDVTSPEEFCTIAGTWSINEYIARAPVTDGRIAMNSLFAIPGYFLVEECSATSAGNLDWFARHFIGRDEVPGDRKVFQWLDEQVAALRPEDSEVYFLPFLHGSNDDPLGKASFVGLTGYHGKIHCARAVYEGVAYSHKTHIDRLLATRPAPRAIRMAGGAVNSAVWVQMFADVLGYPVETIGVKELGALGCAMAAAIAAGEFKDYGEAVAAMVRIGARVEPDPAARKVYAAKYETYAAIRDALAGVWRRFAV
jgi:L-xylulokinase